MPAIVEDHAAHLTIPYEAGRVDWLTNHEFH